MLRSLIDIRLEADLALARKAEKKSRSDSVYAFSWLEYVMGSKKFSRFLYSFADFFFCRDSENPIQPSGSDGK